MKLTLVKHSMLVLQGIAFLLGVLCPPALSAEQLISTQPASISTISMQRTWCFGACPIDSVTLSSDGTADYTGRANVARIGRYQGKIAAETFTKLLSWLEDQNFFAMKAQVGTGNGDTDDVIVSVSRDGKIPSTVVFRFGSGTYNTEMKIKGAILKAAETVAWEKDETSSYSGVIGSARRPLTPNEQAMEKRRSPSPKGAEQELGVDFNWMPFARVVATPVLKLEPLFTTWCDDNGQFHLLLPPGRYALYAFDSSKASYDGSLWNSPWWMVNSQNITVEAGKMSDATFLFDDRVRSVIEAKTKSGTQ